MTEMDIRKKVREFCDELSFHDAWMWGNTCSGIVNNFDYRRPSYIIGTEDEYIIKGVMRNSQRIELTRSPSGWAILWGKP